jgi:hypothetical protein
MEEQATPILWGPTDGKSLLAEFPELNNYREFKELTKEDLNFAWYMGNQSSPLNDGTVHSDIVKARSAAARCIKSPEKRKEYGELNIPSSVKEAIKKMSTFSPVARMIAKQIATTAFNNLQAMVNVNVQNDFKISRNITSGTGKDKTVEQVEEMDWTGRKQYVDTVAKISDLLPDLLKQVEEGFGVEERDDKNKEIGMKAIDKFHQHNQES